MQGLNKQQEDFLQGLARGYSQRQAYINAYPHAANWKPAVVDVRASELFRQSKIQVRWRELQMDAQIASSITRDAILSELRKIGFADIDLRRLKPADKLRALELIARITGCDSPEY